MHPHEEAAGSRVGVLNHRGPLLPSAVFPSARRLTPRSSTAASSGAGGGWRATRRSRSPRLGPGPFLRRRLSTGRADRSVVLAGASPAACGQEGDMAAEGDRASAPAHTPARGGDGLLLRAIPPPRPVSPPPPEATHGAPGGQRPALGAVTRQMRDSAATTATAASCHVPPPRSPEETPSLPRLGADEDPGLGRLTTGPRSKHRKTVRLRPHWIQAALPSP